MDEFQPTRSLMIAVFAQTVKDSQSTAKHHRHDARTFLQAQGFAWLWEGITDDMVGVPLTEEVRKLALAGKLEIPANYQQFHSRKEVRNYATPDMQG